MASQLDNLFSGTISTLTRSLDLRSRKHEMILKNVANADTPNYRPFKLNVEEALQEELDPANRSSLALTDEQHLQGEQMAGDSSSGIKSGAQDTLLFRGDQNGVDIDAEMATIAKNSLLYKASTQIVASKFRGLKNAISGGTK